MGGAQICLLFGMECTKSSIYAIIRRYNQDEHEKNISALYRDENRLKKILLMKIAAALLFSAGFCIMWITCVYSAQIKFEYFYDQTVMEMFGDEVGSFTGLRLLDYSIYFSKKSI